MKKQFVCTENGESFYLVGEGMGGFLNPPGDVEHEYGFISYIRNREQSSFSIRHAAQENNHLPTPVRELASKLLDENKKLLQSLPVDELWVRSVYNYFRHCYSPDGVERSVSVCKIDPKNNQPPEYHLAYLFIKELYPHYPVRVDLIAYSGPGAAWHRVELADKNLLP